jgi:HlyD family secretion protein
VKKRKWIVAVVVVVVVVCLAYAGISVWQSVTAGQAAAQAIGEETAVVTRGTLRVTVGGSGSLSPEDELALSFPSGGEVAEVLVDVGDVVQTGDVLARLDDTDARQAVAQAELAVQQAQVNLDSARIEAEAGLAQANLEAAQTGYEEASTMAAHSGDQLTSARVNLAQAQDQLERAQEDYDQAWDPARDWELNVSFRKDRLESERESTLRALQSAQYSLEVAQAAYNLAVAGVSDSSVQSARAQMLNAQVTVDKQPLQIQQLEIALSQAQLQLESAQRTLAEMTLVAPVGGTVTALNVQAGEMAGGGTAVVLSNLTTLVVDISLDETDVANASIGQAAIVTLDAFSGTEITGTVASIAPVAQVQSGVVLYPVTVRLSPTELPVRGGMTADVEIVTASRESVLIVPLRAIQSADGQSFVLRQVAGGQGSTPPGGFERVPVTLGLTNDVEIEITSGLSAGDVVSVVAAPAQSTGGGFGPFRMFGGGGN